MIIVVQAFLVFVAASLFVNGVWLWQGRRTDGRPALAGKDIAVVNLFTALFGFAVARSSWSNPVPRPSPRRPAT